MLDTVVSREALQEILNAVASPIFVKDRDHRFVLVNQALCDLLGLDRETLIGRSDFDFQPPEQAAVFWAMDDEVFTTGRTHENEEVVTDGSGVIRVVVTRKQLAHVSDLDGSRAPLLVGVISDVTRFRDAEMRAHYVAHHDPLTGLPNRIPLQEKLEATCQGAASRFALLLVDLDAFKAVNDERGHAAGDEVLRIVGERLAGAVRTVDMVARLGGDEFCILQMADDQPGAGLGLAEDVLDLLAQPMAEADPVGASIGIAIFPDDAETADLLLERADLALYAVKRAGRHGCRRYDATMTPAGRDRTAVPDWPVEADLRAAIGTAQLSLVYQPIAAAADGALRGFEAQPRWRHPTRGEIPPSTFIPAAEASGLIHRLGEWVLHEACVEATRWRCDVGLTIGISAVQLRASGFPALVTATLAQAGLAARRLELEITGAALSDPSERAAEVFARLKALGILFALNELGAGWPSLHMLRRFPFDRIKIDRSLVIAMESEARSAAIVRTVLSLGRAFNLPVTADGVKTAAQLIALRRLGCNRLQGALIGRPMPKATPPGRGPWVTAGRGRHPVSLMPGGFRPSARRAAHRPD